MPKSVTPLVALEKRIFTVRGLSVLLDTDLAELYGVDTKALLQAMRRNQLRFPDDFVFRLTNQEVKNLRSQIVTSSLGSRHGGRRVNPFAFTEQGVAMLSSVLRSPRAVAVNIAIMRAFVRLRRRAESGEIGGDLGKMIRWFFADRATRTISPFSTMTLSEYRAIMDEKH